MKVSLSLLACTPSILMSFAIWKYKGELKYSECSDNKWICSQNLQSSSCDETNPAINFFLSIKNYLTSKHYYVSVKKDFWFRFKVLYMIAFYCVCSYVHGGSSRYDGTQRSGCGDGVLLQRGRDTLLLTGDTVVVHQEPRGLDGQTALDNQRSRSNRGKQSKIKIPSKRLLI